MAHLFNLTMVRRLAALAALELVIAPLFAHDMWIEPTTFFPATGSIVGAKLRVGQNLLGDPLPRDTGLIKDFIFEDSEGRKSLVGRDGSDPAGYLRIASPGLVVVGYLSNPSAVELEAEKFNQYLKDEGLDGIAALRAQRKQTGAKARELFTRCAKSLVLSGAPGEKQTDRQLGFTLELFAERNPYLLHPGDELPLRLTYLNKPLPGALVIAMNRLNPVERVSARTDAAGRVKLPLRAEGMWMIKAVHMIPAAAGTNADWMSYWASLTFEMQNTSNTASK